MIRDAHLRWARLPREGVVDVPPRHDNGGFAFIRLENRQIPSPLSLHQRLFPTSTCLRPIGFPL